MNLMANFDTIPITKTELIKWKNNPNKNPRTGRKIGMNGQLYKYISVEYDKFINLKENLKETFKEPLKEPLKESLKEPFKEDRKNITFNLIDSIDDKDPVTLKPFWIIKNNIKEVVYDGSIDDLILYKDSHNLIRCFEKETLSYLKAHKITKNPVSQEDIPNELFNLVEEIDLKEERKNMTIHEKSLEVFQKFSKISIFIDSEWFVELTKDKLIKFHYEASSFYKENLDMKQKKIISSEIRFYKKDKIHLFLENI